MPLRVEWLGDQADFWALEREWRALLARSRQDQVFLTWRWIASWWQAFGGERQLWLLLARDEDGSLRGIAPLCRRRARWAGLLPYHLLELMGSGLAAADHLDFIMEAGREQAVATALVEGLWQRRGEWDMLALEGMAAGSPVLRLLKEKVPAFWGQAWRESCPIILLPADWSTFLAGRGKNLRRNLQRYTRALEKQNEGAQPYALVVDPAAVAATMDALFAQHQAVRQAQGNTGAFAGQRMVRFHRQLARDFLAAGWLRLYRLEVRGQIAAVVYCFAYRGVVSYYATGYDAAWSKYGPGRQLIGFMVQQAIAEGMGAVDFLRGDEAYKYDWTDVAVEDVYLRLPSGWRGCLIALLRRLRGVVRRGSGPHSWRQSGAGCPGG